MQVVRLLLALSFTAFVVPVFRYHAHTLTNTQGPLWEMSLLGLLQALECAWWDIFWIYWIISNTRQYKWNCFQWKLFSFGLPVIPDLLCPLISVPFHNSFQAQRETALWCTTNNYCWVSNLLCCCVTVAHLLHKGGEGRTLLPALGVRRGQSRSSLGSGTMGRLWQPSGGSPVETLQPKAENESFSPSRTFGRDSIVVFYRALFINSSTCSLPLDAFFVFFFVLPTTTTPSSFDMKLSAAS